MNRHDLTIRPRRDSVLSDGECSCLQWQLRNATEEVIREAHAAHVQIESGAYRETPREEVTDAAR